jgi:hypothetical protein
MQLTRFVRRGREYTLADEGKPHTFGYQGRVGELNVDVNGDGQTFAPYVLSGANLKYGESECEFADGYQSLRRLGATIVSRSQIYIQRETSPGVWADVPHGLPTRNVAENYPSEGRVTAYLDFPDIQGYAQGNRLQVGLEAGGGDGLTFGFRFRSRIAGTFRLEWVLNVPGNVALEWVYERTSTADPTPIRIGGRIGPVTIRWTRAEAAKRSATVEDDGAGGKNIRIVLGPYTVAAQEWLVIYPDTVNGTEAAAADDQQIYYDGGWAIASSNSVLWFGYYGSNPDLATFRFVLDAAIPDGATINSAVLSLYGYSDEAVAEFWACVTESADAAQITTAAGRPTWAGSGGTTTYPTTREGTGAGHWTSYDWLLEQYNNLSVTGLVQYLVDTYSGLASGAHVNFFLCGDEAENNQENGAYAQEESSGSKDPYLTITYTAGGPPAGGGGYSSTEDRFRFRPSQRV